MGQSQVQAQAFGGYKPSLGITHLARCSQCHGPHPLARLRGIKAEDWRAILADPSRADDACPDCGAPSAPGHMKEVDAKLPGFWGWRASMNLAIGRFLFRLAKRIT